MAVQPLSGAKDFVIGTLGKEQPCLRVCSCKDQNGVLHRVKALDVGQLQQRLAIGAGKEMQVAFDKPWHQRRARRIDDTGFRSGQFADLCLRPQREDVVARHGQGLSPGGSAHGQDLCIHEDHRGHHWAGPLRRGNCALKGSNTRLTRGMIRARNIVS